MSNPLEDLRVLEACGVRYDDFTGLMCLPDSYEWNLPNMIQLRLDHLWPALCREVKGVMKERPQLDGMEDVWFCVKHFDRHIHGSIEAAIAAAILWVLELKEAEDAATD